jgi:hypothetical protein
MARNSRHANAVKHAPKLRGSTTATIASISFVDIFQAGYHDAAIRTARHEHCLRKRGVGF